MDIKLEVNISLVPKIRDLDITTRYFVATNFLGDYKSVFKGRGIEFDGYRKYSPEDEANLIDWRASKKSGELLVREYVEERNLEINFLLDTSSTMVFGSLEKLKHEYAAEFVASISAHAIGKGDAIGMFMFSDDMKSITPPSVGMRQYHAILKNLVNPKNYGGKCNFGKALAKANVMMRPRSILFIVSDFIGMGENWGKHLRTAGVKYDAIAVIVRDPRDLRLPDGVNQVVLGDPYSEKQMVVDVRKIREKYEKEVQRELNELRKEFAEGGVGCVELETSNPFPKPIMAFLEKRKYQHR